MRECQPSNHSTEISEEPSKPRAPPQNTACREVPRDARGRRTACSGVSRGARGRRTACSEVSRSAKGRRTACSEVPHAREVVARHVSTSRAGKSSPQEPPRAPPRASRSRGNKRALQGRFRNFFDHVGRSGSGEIPLLHLFLLTGCPIIAARRM